MAEGPEAAYPSLAALAQPLEHYALFHATRGDLLRRMGRRREAMAAYTRAVELQRNEPLRASLNRRIAALR
jgi:RNA polymerase sigma-70 factor (ECF subfamily)